MKQILFDWHCIVPISEDGALSRKVFLFSKSITQSTENENKKPSLMKSDLCSAQIGLKFYFSLRMYNKKIAHTEWTIAITAWGLKSLQRFTQSFWCNVRWLLGVSSSFILHWICGTQKLYFPQLKASWFSEFSHSALLISISVSIISYCCFFSRSHSSIDLTCHRQRMGQGWQRYADLDVSHSLIEIIRRFIRALCYRRSVHSKTNWRAVDLTAHISQTKTQSRAQKRVYCCALAWIQWHDRTECESVSANNGWSVWCCITQGCHYTVRGKLSRPQMSTVTKHLMGDKSKLFRK